MIQENSPLKDLLVKLRNYFISGLLFSLPLMLSVYVLTWIVTTVDEWIQPLIPFGAMFNLPFTIPGIGIVIVILLFIIIGALTKGFLGKVITGYSEQIFSKMPIVRSVYSATKQISEAVLQSQSQAFREVGLIEYPRAGMWVLCFTTGATTGEIRRKGGKELVNVFVPTTPNPTSGFLLFVPAEDIIPLTMSVEAGIKMVVSAGMITPLDESNKK